MPKQSKSGAKPAGAQKMTALQEQSLGVATEIRRIIDVVQRSLLMGLQDGDVAAVAACGRVILTLDHAKKVRFLCHPVKPLPSGTPLEWVALPMGMRLQMVEMLPELVEQLERKVEALQSKKVVERLASCAKRLEDRYGP